MKVSLFRKKKNVSLKVSFDACGSLEQSAFRCFEEVCCRETISFLWGEGRRLWKNVSPILCFAKLLVFEILKLFSNLLNLKVLVGGFSWNQINLKACFSLINPMQFFLKSVQNDPLCGLLIKVGFPNAVKNSSKTFFKKDLPWRGTNFLILN